LTPDTFEPGLEGFVEVVLIVEVLTAVGFAFPHFTDADQVVHDLAEVASGMNPPAIEDGFGQCAVLLECILSDRLAELLTGQVSIRFSFIVFVFSGVGRQLHDALSVCEAFVDELISIQMVSLVFGQKFHHG